MRNAGPLDVFDWAVHDVHATLEALREASEQPLREAERIADENLAGVELLSQMSDEYLQAVVSFAGGLALTCGMRWQGNAQRVIDKGSRRLVIVARDEMRGVLTYLRRGDATFSALIGTCCADCDEALLILATACERCELVFERVIAAMNERLADEVASREHLAPVLPLIPPQPEEDHRCAVCRRRPRRLIVDGVGYCNRCADAKGLRAQGPIR